MGGIHGFELQLELVGYEGNEFGIGGLALGVADGVAEKTLQGVQNYRKMDVAGSSFLTC